MIGDNFPYTIISINISGNLHIHYVVNFTLKVVTVTSKNFGDYCGKVFTIFFLLIFTVSFLQCIHVQGYCNTMVSI